MAFRTLTIGRSERSDIRLEDTSVSRLHAELTLTAEGRCFLTDRNSLRGITVLRGDQWIPHRQGYVEQDARIRFGKQEVVLRALLPGHPFPSGAEASAYEQVSVKPRRNASSGETEID